ncbi:adenosine deaminase CECR1-A [Achaetomium macrosporum]|uniref:adenosine deaminase n=1 Tax=Achaetomium macrosporum TaxID=79813 RepID=A0AAN7CHY6_9PEZI|nr:adenosine deaminase CECR1-A [Achaetomium macrosporum]
MALLTDEEWADFVAHELPKTSDPVIQKFLQSRNALIAEERKHRSDYSFRQALSPISKKACDIVSRICRKERGTNNATVPRETTKSWQIIWRMPKGALLRAHCHSLVDMDHLIDAMMDTPGMHISCTDGHLATEATRKEGGLCIRFRGKADSEDCSLWANDYKPGSFIPLAKAADSFPGGGRRGFVEFLKARCRISRQDHNLGDIWAAVSRSSEVIGGMLCYEPIWRAFLQRLASNLVQDGIPWVELRLTLPLTYYREGSEIPDPDYDHMFQAIEEEVAKFRATDLGKPFQGLRIIWSARRSQDRRSIIEDADNCIATKLLRPHLVAGYDLGGSLNSGRPLVDLLPELFWFRKQCALEGVQIPFFLRAGGYLDDGDGDGGGADGGVFNAVLLGTRRIGNASSLYRHPRLIDAVKDKRILVETCPTPDGILHSTSDSIACHPLPVLLAQGVPCALCDDDSEILLGQGGGWRMTNVFWQVLHAWDSVSLAGLGSLAENSVRWAAFEDQDAEAWARDIRAASVGAGIKAARLQQWAVEWERFCLWIVTEYGDDAYGAEQ